MFAKAGITTMPATLDEYTSDLKKLQSAGVSAHPLDIPFAAAEGLSTYWYETTGALGGTVLDQDGKPQFTSPDSPGYKAAEWMISAIKSGLVPKGNINVTDSQGMQTLMAKGQVGQHLLRLLGQRRHAVQRAELVVGHQSGRVHPDAGRDRRRGQLEQPGRHRHPEAGEVPEGGRQVHPVVHQRAASRSTSPASTARRRPGRPTRCRHTSARSRSWPPRATWSAATP